MLTLGIEKRPSFWLLVGLALSLPLAHLLPVSWGWENGPLETLQALTLLAGCLTAAWSAWSQRRQSGAAIWRIAAILWLCMLGRELAWGAVFYAPLGMDAHSGPLYSSSVLWFKPAVKWVCAALLVLCMFWVWRCRLLGRVLWPWLQQRLMPWDCLLVFVLSMLLSANAEGHSYLPLLQSLPIGGMVAEEMAECWAYACLWWAQWHLIACTTAWWRGSRMPMHLRYLDSSVRPSLHPSPSQSL
ncbi:MAG: hypothetical protein KBT18_12415 [Comamonas sp.]|nr:hypothetical protein [Candidatus Comamonas equi]